MSYNVTHKDTVSYNVTHKDTVSYNVTQYHIMPHNVAMLHTVIQCYTNVAHNINVSVTHCHTLIHVVLHNVTVSHRLMLHKSYSHTSCYRTHGAKDLADGCLQLILSCSLVHVATQQECH